MTDRLERLLSINVAVLVALSTLLLGMGQRQVVLPALMLVAVTASLWLTDLTGWLRLNRTATNGAMLLAVAACAWDLLGREGVSEAAAISRLLVWVEIVLLFQQKDLRTWVQLMILSLVQVTVAALVPQKIWFGLLAVVYVAVGLPAVSLVFLQFERTYYQRHGSARLVSAASGGRFRRFQVNWRRLGKIALATLVVGPLSLFLRYGESEGTGEGEIDGAVKPAGTGRWPLLFHDAVLLVPEPRPGEPEGLTWEFWVRLLKFLPATLLTAAVIFPFVPRLGRFEIGLYRVGWFESNTRSDPVRTAGFSDEVVLGELGLLSNDMKKVAEVEFTHTESKQPYEVSGEVYLRGAVLTEYADGQWKYRGQGHRLRRGVDPRLRSRLVQQKITVEPLDRSELFCVWPFVLRRGDRYFYNPKTERLLRADRQRNQRFTFTLDTPALVDGVQVALVPSDGPVAVRPLLAAPPHPMPRLEALARQWAQESGAAPEDWVRVARYMESKLRDSERFAYSSMGAVRDEQLDPIEDFVINNPTGNCEYFATALTLMLRSQGIPARLVVGFKTDEFSNLRNVFVARQAHAHTWVEVYLDPEHLPDELKALSSFPDWSHGGWLRLDPTPARDLTPVEALLGGMENWWAWLCEAWEQYVMGMNRQQQRELVYGPLRRSFLARLRRVGTLAWWKELWEQVRRAPGWLAWYFAEGRWFSWRGGLAAVVLLLTGYFLWRGLCALARLARILWSRVARHRDDSRRVQVAFYRRFEALLARRGLRRRTSQTPREFATAAGGQLAAVTGHAGLEGLPRQVADAFYQVRFGDTALEPLQEQAVDEALGRLEEALRAHPQRRLLARLNVRPEAVRRPT